jgi:hypothetical protein
MSAIICHGTANPVLLVIMPLCGTVFVPVPHPDSGLYLGASNLAGTIPAGLSVLTALSCVALRATCTGSLAHDKPFQLLASLCP